MSLVNPNQTASRVFKLLCLLLEGPLSFEQINEKFLEDPQIQKKVSFDSVGLYMNTLKQLGCKISRPSRKNNFRYELIYHPFGIALTPFDIETLAKVKTLFEEALPFEEVLTLHEFFKKTILQSSMANRNDMIDTLFEKNRTLDYSQHAPKIKALQHATFEKQLLRIDYLSPEKGKEDFAFLGESLTYKDGALYIKGYQPHRDDLVLLRVDRIEALQVIEDEMLRTSLLQKALLSEEQILILFPGLSPEEYEPYGLHEQLESFQQYAPTQHHSEPSLLAIFQQKDKFYLKQKLLGEDKPFKIMGPESFKIEMKETLLGMQALYQKETQP